MKSAIFPAILCIPGAVALVRLMQGEWASELLHGTGEFSARLMILSMMVSPLRLALPRARWVAWLLRKRRIIGVAAFLYALLHTLFYVIDMGSWQNVSVEFKSLGIWTGWLALGLFIVLGATSNDISVRRMGPQWKSLHRVIYPAAILVLVHWMVVHNNQRAALLNFTPLIGLELFRVFRLWKSGRFRRKKQARTHA